MANATAGGPGVPQTEANPPGGMVPFRRATTSRTARLPDTGPQLLTTSQQQVQTVIDGSGYIYAIDLDVQATVPSTNSATVAYNEDAPYNALASNVFGDVNGELINLDGYSLYLANLYGGWQSYKQSGSSDTSIYALVSGSGATGGNFRFHLKVPVALNRRSLLGLVANQDRAQKYSLRSDIAASSVIYGTAPTALPNITIRRVYENYSVPSAQNANGASQQQTPPKFGVLHFITQSVNPSVPAGSSTVTHYLPRLGKTIRLLILVLRSNSSRATAESNLPTQITFKLGDTPLFTETPAFRRAIMFTRYGFDAPSGVFVYDFVTDILNVANFGGEMGEDYAFTNGLVNATFEIAYPSGFGSTANSLTVITDDLEIPSNVDIYAPDA